MLFYFGLVVCLVALFAKFAQHAFNTLAHTLSLGVKDVIVAILSLIDLSLVANLLLIVIFAGYEGLVSRLDVDGAARLDWMGRIGFGDLKRKLMVSIVAISSIYVLEKFINVEHVSDRELTWVVVIYLVFVVSSLLLAAVDRVAGQGH